jgi:hypothetical protein
VIPFPTEPPKELIITKTFWLLLLGMLACFCFFLGVLNSLNESLYE